MNKEKFLGGLRATLQGAAMISAGVAYSAPLFMTTLTEPVMSKEVLTYERAKDALELMTKPSSVSHKTLIDYVKDEKDKEKLALIIAETKQYVRNGYTGQVYAYEKSLKEYNEGMAKGTFNCYLFAGLTAAFGIASSLIPEPKEKTNFITPRGL